jgi:hypothetical protein
MEKVNRCRLCVAGHVPSSELVWPSILLILFFSRRFNVALRGESGIFLLATMATEFVTYKATPLPGSLST